MRFQVGYGLLALTSLTHFGCTSFDRQGQKWPVAASQPQLLPNAASEPPAASASHTEPNVHWAGFHAPPEPNPISSLPGIVTAVEPATLEPATLTETTQFAHNSTPGGPSANPIAQPPSVVTVASSVLPNASVSSSPSDMVPTQVATVVEPAPLPPTGTTEQSQWPIDLATALELTSGQNPQVAYARERIRESYARLMAANALWLPSLRAGANYHKHEGRIQDVAGTIIETSRNSVYNGIGAQAVGAGSPAVPGVLMNFHLRDSMFQPRIAGQMVGASRQASLVANNDILLETAIAYCDLLESTQLKSIADTTRQNVEQLAQVTTDFAKVGEGLPADADRSAAELAVRKMEVQRALEQQRIRSVRLARLLSQDPLVVLSPTEPFLAPVTLVDETTELSSLVAQGLASRPELTEHKYLVGEAIERLRREQYAPLVPSVLLGLSYGGNGGGLGSSFQNYGDRMDFDAAAFWEIRNLGMGERAARCEAESRVRQARLRHVQELDQVAAEIVEAHTLVQAKKDQIPFAESAVASAQDSYRRNQERILNAQGLPIEALQAITALDQAQRLYAATIADYNRAQFQLYRALGFAVMDRE